MDRSPRLRRRTLLSTAAAAAAGAAAVGASARPGPARAAALRPVSMAMHIHAPFSEGIASFEAHLQQARQHKVDVIWWTDHDFRVAAHDHRRAVHFTGPSEPEGELSWTWTPRTEGALTAKAVDFVPTPHSPDDAGPALRLSATGGPGILWYAGTAWNFTYSTCVADTTLELDVLAERTDPDAVLLVQVELSHHPARAGRPAGIYALRYRIGAVGYPGWQADGLLGTVDLPVPAGTWRRLTLDPVADIHRLWPDLVAGDNSLRNLALGVSAGPGATGSFVVDRLLFHRARRTGQDAEDLRAEVLAPYAAEYPDVTHHRAYEVSLVRHLNWFGGDQTLPAFPSPPYRDNDAGLTRSMVDFLHSHGGIVCWNHPMDVEKRGSLAKLMIERNNLGADLVEIGRKPYDDLLWVYDVAARNAIFFTAVGSSDDHNGTDWLREPERHITYVWAASTGLADLVTALRKGRAWFTDPARYRGSLDILVDGATAMGGVAVTQAAKVPVQFLATRLPAGGKLEIVSGVTDLAGTGTLKPAVKRTLVAPSALRNGRYSWTVKPGDGGYVRTQVRASDNTVIAVSNPLWLLRRKPPRGIPADRRLRL